MPNRWTEFVKQYASANDLSYGCALSKPECKASYRKKYGDPKPKGKKKEIESMGMEDFDAPAPPKENVVLKVTEKAKRGRKPKYATDEERKAAKRTQTLTSNASKRYEKAIDFLETPKEKSQMKKAETYLIRTIEDDTDAFFIYDYQEYRPYPRLDDVDFDEFDERYGIVDIAKKFGVSPRELFNLYDDWTYASYPGYKVKKDGQTANGNGKSYYSYKDAKKEGYAVKEGKGITKKCEKCEMKNCDSCCMGGEGILDSIVKTAKKGVAAVSKAQAVVKKGVNTGIVAGLSSVSKDAGNYYKAVTEGRDDYSPKVRALLKKYGNEVIVSAAIVRNPVQSALIEVMNVVSLGQFKKNLNDSPYDKLFHLQLDFTLASGRKLRVEKVEVINMDEGHTNKSDGEVQPITPIPENLTLNMMMDNAKKLMGGKYFLYSAKDNNCQDFLMAILQGSNMGNAEDYAFTKQNTKDMFKGLDSLRKISNTLTDLGATINVATTGAGLNSESAIILKHLKMIVSELESKK